MLAKFRTSKRKKEIVERVKVTEVFQQVLQQRSDHNDQGRMLNFLRREFPMSFERFLFENGGLIPHIPLQFPLAMGSCGSEDYGETKDAGTMHDVLIETEAVVSTLMCAMPSMAIPRDIPPQSVEKAVANDVWTLLSGIFCFSGSKQYAPDDSDYIVFDGSMSESDTPSPSPGAMARKKKPKSLASRLNPLKLLGPTASATTATSGTGGVQAAPSRAAPLNPLVFQPRPGIDYRAQHAILVQDLTDESQRIIKLYTGLFRERGISFNWVLKTSKNNIFVHNCDLPGSSFSALKSDCTIKKDKYTILRYLTDDERSKEYDETLDGYKLIEIVDDRTKIRRYFYKGIWPCSARDFVLLTTWRELDDGSILVSTISPPDEYYPHNDGFVRASIHCSGAHIRPIDSKLGGGCAITVIGHSDLKGSIPSVVINQLSSSIPYKFMRKFQSAVQAT